MKPLFRSLPLYIGILTIAFIPALADEAESQSPGPDAFIFSWTAGNASRSLILSTDYPLHYRDEQGYIIYNDTVNVHCTIDWGDGVRDSIYGLSPGLSHAYASAGDYLVTIEGRFPVLVPNPGKRDSLRIEQWGKMQWKYFDFRGKKLTLEASDLPDLSMMKGMVRAFHQATVIGDLDSWDVSSVEVMDYTFSQCAFNGEIGNWDVSNVTSMGGMFENSEFNGDISEWNVSSVENMSYMFSYYTDLNGYHPFNGDISAWDVSSVIYMSGMFQKAGDFNQDISGWDVSNVLYMNGLFFDATSFNQDIGNWDVSSVISMDAMFFYAYSFNQDIGDWDVSNVTSMDGLFYDGTFDQNLGNWDVSNVGTFESEYPFNLSLSVSNYDSLLTGWSKLDLQDNLSLSVAQQYSSAAHCARLKIITEHNWTFNDLGPKDTIPDDCYACADYIDLPDMDDDGVPDKCDICAGYNDTIDQDADGFPDGCDICQGFNDSIDSDQNGIPDGCDQVGIGSVSPGLLLSPNPVRSALLVDWSRTDLRNPAIKILSVNGRIIWETNEVSGNLISIDLGSLPEGMYFIRLITGNNSKLLKFIKD